MSAKVKPSAGEAVSMPRLPTLGPAQGFAIDLWVDAGFDRESAADYLDAIKNTINHPNAVLDIRITGSAEYLQTLDVEISRAVAGETSPQEALNNVAKAWNEITDRLGRENQLQQYRSAVGWSK